MKLIFLPLLIVLLITSCQFEPECSSIDLIESSIEVTNINQKVVGFNTDTDSLKFGRLSPSSSVKRMIKASYSQEADVLIKMKGDFSSWMEINPAKFHLNEGETKEVSFEVIVPRNTQSGEYWGEVEFCFVE